MSLGQEEIGSKIRKARKLAKLSQKQLAEKIGVADAQSVSNYERGVTEVSMDRLREVATATSQPMSYFLAEPPPEEEPLRLAIREETAEIRNLVERIAKHLGLDDSLSAGDGP